jgi:hypothetical protein
MARKLPTPTHESVWMGASLVFGVFLLWIAAHKNLLQDPTTRLFNFGVLLIAWVLGAVLLRIFVAGLVDPTSTKGLLSRRKRR